MGRRGKPSREFCAAFAALAILIGAFPTGAGAAAPSWPGLRLLFAAGLRDSGQDGVQAAADPIPAGPNLTTIVTGRPDEGTTFVLTCRSDINPSNMLAIGYCQGYISSKLGRLPKAKLRDLRRKQADWHKRFGSDDASLTRDIMAVVRSARFDPRHLAELKSRFDHPLTAEDVLNHVINNLLYVEEN